MAKLGPCILKIDDPGESFEVTLPNNIGPLLAANVLSLTLFRCSVYTGTQSRPPLWIDLLEEESFEYRLHKGGVFKNGGLTFKLANSAKGGFRGGFFYAYLYRVDDHASGQDGNPINPASNIVEYVEPGAQPWRPAPIPN